MTALRTMRRLGTALTLSLALVPGGMSQVLHVAAGVGNLNAGEGASVGLLDSDSATTVGLGEAQGVRLSARREVTVGASSLAIGDSTLALQLPTDLDSAARLVQARGLLLRNGNSSIFAGVTGANYANAYVSAVTPSRFVSAVATEMPLGKSVLALLHTAGVRNNALVSWTTAGNPFRRFAATVGRSQGKTVVRLLAHVDGGQSRLDVSLGMGRLQLRPALPREGAQPERTGLNVMALHRFGQAWTVDAARHLYDTGDVQSDPMYAGVVSSRSQLLEAGTSFAAHALRLQARLLDASSGPQRSIGTVALAGWMLPHWGVQVSSMRNRNSMAGTPPQALQSSLQVQTTQQVRPRLRLEQDLNLGGNSSGMSAGGAWEGNRVSLSVTERQTFVPFGTARGFHPVMVLNMRIRLGIGEASASVSRGTGLPTTVLVGTDSYHGGVTEGAVPASAELRMPHYLVTGQVVDTAGQPVRGAAVQVADQVVFTDSEGRFLQRLTHRRPVSVRTLPEQFVTDRRYRGVGAVKLVQPVAAEAEAPINLQVESCGACGTEAAPAIAALEASAPDPGYRAMFARAGHALAALAKRMVQRRPAISA